MATIKSYTDLEQSRKLAEFLPFESADQTWARIAIAGNLDVSEELQYRHNGDMPFQYYSGIGIPCWSLVALLKILSFPSLTQNKEDEWEVCVFDHDNDDYIEKTASNPVDACVKMIEKLHGLKML